MKEAIQKAIEAGYGSYVGSKWEVKSVIPHSHKYSYVCEVRTDDEISNGKPWYRYHVVDNFLLDPKFWQSLAKAEGWQPIGWMDIEYILPDCTPIVKNAAQWQYEMHRLLDYLIDGKDPDLFFKELLK